MSNYDPLSELFQVIGDRIQNPVENSYTCKLIAGGDNTMLKKIGEETAEVIMAFKDNEPSAIAGETADLLYHLLVALAAHGVDLQLVYRQLEQRRK